MAKTSYIRGSKGTKATPLQVPNKPVNFSITKDVSLFQGQGKSPKLKGK